MTDLQGAIGQVQLKKLDYFIEERNKWGNFYKRELADIEWIILPEFSVEFQHGLQSFVILVEENKSPFSRNEIMEKLLEKGISSRPGTHAVHMLRYYKDKYQILPEDFPGAQIANDKSISIPIHNQMVKEDFEYVVQCIKNIY